MFSSAYQASFFQDFHPHFPILDPNNSCSDCHQRSPLLFWTINAIAARGHKVLSFLRSELQRPLMDLLWTKTSTIPPSHFTIQAQLLLCIWPFSPPTLIADPSLSLASLAKAGCMQLGLHQPNNMQDYNRVRFEINEAHVAEAAKLWVAAFVVAGW
jgi:hypothetical protein